MPNDRRTDADRVCKRCPQPYTSGTAVVNLHDNVCEHHWSCGALCHLRPPESDLYQSLLPCVPPDHELQQVAHALVGLVVRHIPRQHAAALYAHMGAMPLDSLANAASIALDELGARLAVSAPNPIPRKGKTK